LNKFRNKKKTIFKSRRRVIKFYRKVSLCKNKLRFFFAKPSRFSKESRNYSRINFLFFRNTLKKDSNFKRFKKFKRFKRSRKFKRFKKFKKYRKYRRNFKFINKFKRFKSRVRFIKFQKNFNRIKPFRKKQKKRKLRFYHLFKKNFYKSFNPDLSFKKSFRKYARMHKYRPLYFKNYKFKKVNSEKGFRFKRFRFKSLLWSKKKIYKKNKRKKKINKVIKFSNSYKENLSYVRGNSKQFNNKRTHISKLFTDFFVISKIILTKVLDPVLSKSIRTIVNKSFKRLYELRKSVLISKFKRFKVFTTNFSKSYKTKKVIFPVSNRFIYKKNKDKMLRRYFGLKRIPRKPYYGMRKRWHPRRIFKKLIKKYLEFKIRKSYGKLRRLGYILNGRAWRRRRRLKGRRRFNVYWFPFKNTIRLNKHYFDLTKRRLLKKQRWKSKYKRFKKFRRFKRNFRRRGFPYELNRTKVKRFVFFNQYSAFCSSKFIRYAFYNFLGKFLSSQVYITMGLPVRIKFNFFPINKAKSTFFLNFITTKLYYRYILYDIIKPIVRMSMKFYRGFVIHCRGRFTRAQIAVSKKFMRRSVSYSRMTSLLDYSQKAITLRYGTCNLRIWIRK
jgi:hypothetical protein